MKILEIQPVEVRHIGDSVGAAGIVRVLVERKVCWWKKKKKRMWHKAFSSNGNWRFADQPEYIHYPLTRLMEGHGKLLESMAGKGSIKLQPVEESEYEMRK